MILQEEFKHNPFKMLIACIMLNMTSNLQVRRVIYSFFEKWPTSEALDFADPDQISEHIKSLGFRNRRTKTILKFANSWHKFVNGTIPLKKLPGIGQYAVDSYNIFVLNDLSVKPKDKILQAYLRGENIQPHRLDPRFQRSLDK